MNNIIFPKIYSSNLSADGKYKILNHEELFLCLLQLRTIRKAHVYIYIYIYIYTYTNQFLLISVD